MDEVKFFNPENYFIDKTINIRMCVNKACEYLESKGVDISLNSFLKCADIHTRFSLRNSETIVKALENICPIIIIRSPSHRFSDIYDLLMSDKELYEAYQYMFTRVNYIVEDEFKFPEDEFKTIRANLPLVAQTVVEFMNELYMCILEESAKGNSISTKAIYYRKGTHYSYDFGVLLGFNYKYNSSMMITNSYMLSRNDSNAMKVVCKETFPENTTKEFFDYLENLA